MTSFGPRSTVWLATLSLAGALLLTACGRDTPETLKNHPALQGITIPMTGTRSRPMLMATKTLLFTAEGWGSRPVVHVLDKKTGEEIPYEKYQQLQSKNHILPGLQPVLRLKPTSRQM